MEEAGFPWRIWKWVIYAAIHLAVISGNNGADMLTQNEGTDSWGGTAGAAGSERIAVVLNNFTISRFDSRRNEKETIFFFF